LKDGLELADKLAHVNSLAFAQDFAAVLLNLRREFDAAQRRAEALLKIASDYRMAQRFAEATICQGFAMVGQGQEADGIAKLRSGLTLWNRTRARVFQTQWLGFLAEAHLQARQFNKALAALNRAAKTAKKTGECHYQAELHRLRGIALAGFGQRAEAASSLQQAIDTARSQQAKSLELRAATSLARLWRDQGKRAEAHDLLAPIYGSFTEGFDTADLKDAKALLHELA
jgi:predicted ATPase